MPLGQSTPISVPASTIAGLIAGEIAGYVAKEMGGSSVAQRLATGSAHAITSAAVGYGINTVLGLDATGAAVTTIQSPLTAVAHALLRNTDGPLSNPDFSQW